jgi:hypothetical protein
MPKPGTAPSAVPVVQPGAEGSSRLFGYQVSPVLALSRRFMETALANVRDRAVVGVGYALDHEILRLHTRGARAVEARFSPQAFRNAKPSDEHIFIEEPDIGLADTIICSFAVSYVENLKMLAEALAELVVPGADLLVVDLHPEADRLGWRGTLAPEGLPADLPLAVHDLAEVRQAFDDAGFELESLVEPRLGHPEKRLFENIMHPELFQQLRHMPALYLFQFRRRLLSSDRAKRITYRRVRPLAYHLVGANIALGPHTSIQADVVLDPERIRGIYEKPSQSKAQRADGDVLIDLSGYLLLPGMINAHDHLESGINVYGDSGHEAALWMGALKNVISGVTTVLHHEPQDAVCFMDSFPIRVVRNYGWAETFYPKELVSQFRATPQDAPFLLHLTSHSPTEAKEKVHALQQLGIVTDRTVVIHGGGLDGEVLDILHRSGASQVWCPSAIMAGDSQVDPKSVISNHRVALGTAYSSEASHDIFHEIQNALSLGVPAEALYSMVTTRPCSILRLKNGEGRIVAGTPADIIAVANNGATPSQALCAADAHSLDAVMLAGRPLVANDNFLDRLPEAWRKGMEPIRFDGVKRHVRWQLQRLIRNLVDRAGSPQLAGKTLTV